MIVLTCNRPYEQGAEVRGYTADLRKLQKEYDAEFKSDASCGDKAKTFAVGAGSMVSDGIRRLRGRGQGDANAAVALEEGGAEAASGGKGKILDITFQYPGTYTSFMRPKRPLVRIWFKVNFFGARESRKISPNQT